MANISQEKDALMHKTWLLMIRIAFIFGIPAAIAYFVGKYIDTTYDMRPNGTLAVLAVSFVFSWVLTIREYKKLSRAFRELEQREDAEKQAAQQKLQNEMDTNKQTNQ